METADHLGTFRQGLKAYLSRGGAGHTKWSSCAIWMVVSMCLCLSQQKQSKISDGGMHYQNKLATISALILVDFIYFAYYSKSMEDQNKWSKECIIKLRGVVATQTTPHRAVLNNNFLHRWIITGMRILGLLQVFIVGIRWKCCLLLRHRMLVGIL